MIITKTNQPVKRGALLALLLVSVFVLNAQTKVSTLKFKTFNNLVFLKAKVNDSAEMTFILDTGASSCVLNESTSKKLGLKTVSGDKVDTGGGDVDAVYVKNAAIEITSDFTLKNLSLAVIDLSGLEKSIGEKIDGVIGYEAFQNAVVKIDYQNKLLTFFPKDKFVYRGKGEIIPFVIEDVFPFVEVKLTSINGIETQAKLMIDVGGASNAISLYTDFVNKNQLIKANSPTIPLTYGAINVGKSTGEVGRLKTLQIGKIVYQSPLVNFSQTTQGSETDTSYAGILNAPFLSKFTCFIDYQKKQLILEQNASYNTLLEFDMSGISLIASGENLDIYTVRQVLNNSSAAKADIRKGDIIEKINGKPSSAYRLSEIRKMFSSKRNSIITLQLRRADKFLVKKITLTKAV
ncbi:MAG: PDZ domain-containing protein [Acidobacteria bacterium]|nr:PDZ domain-containing protein [Acidobacteriota bacterium]